MEQMDFRKILFIIEKAAKRKETVEIYYPRTDRSVGGWREIEPYSLTTDIPPKGEHLVYGEDMLSPGHILNAYTKDSKDNFCHSFIIGKIKKVRLTHKKFVARNGWKIEF